VQASHPTAIPPADPLERSVPLALKLLALVPCVVLLDQSAVAHSAFPPLTFPFFYSMYYVWIITPLHEGGHLLFALFGRTLHILGGSFWQVMIPVVACVVAARQKSFFSTVYLALAGVNAIALSSYIYDAPYRSLPLLGPKEGHDWYNLLIHWQMLDSAEDLSNVAYFGGLAVGSLAVAGGIAWAFYEYFHPTPFLLKDDETKPVAESRER